MRKQMTTTLQNLQGSYDKRNKLAAFLPNTFITKCLVLVFPTSQTKPKMINKVVPGIGVIQKITPVTTNRTPIIL